MTNTPYIICIAHAGGHSESEGEEEGAIYDDDEEGVDAEVSPLLTEMFHYTGHSRHDALVMCRSVL